MDGNRYYDGVELRYKFGRDNNIPEYVISSDLDNRPCSMLEMMIALARRCEDSIMNDPLYGDRTYIWFSEMIRSLGLDNFNNVNADYILDQLANRNYAKNGMGGLFTINDPSKDMRNVDIWYQMLYFINEYITNSER